MNVRPCVSHKTFQHSIINVAVDSEGCVDYCARGSLLPLHNTATLPKVLPFLGYDVLAIFFFFMVPFKVFVLSEHKPGFHLQMPLIISSR